MEVDSYNYQDNLLAQDVRLRREKVPNLQNDNMLFEPSRVPFTRESHHKNRIIKHNAQVNSYCYQDNLAQERLERDKVINRQNDDIIFRPPIVPGNRQYSSITRYGRKVIVVGDSHLINIKRRLFNDSLINGKGYIKCYKGAKAEDLNYHIMPSLLREKPDIVLINIGSNDINFKNLTIDLCDLAQQIIDLGFLCKQYGVKEVIISSIIPKKSVRLTCLIRELNEKLKNLCEKNQMFFLSNDNIDSSQICNDGIHLTDTGVNMLADNLVDYLNYYLLSNENMNF